MSNNLYLEAIAEAEQLKYVTEEKVKLNLIESMTPQIKELIEQKLSGKEASQSTEEIVCETVEENTDSSGNKRFSESSEISLDEESRSILRKFVNGNSQKHALIEKISEIREAIKTLNNAIILTEGSITTFKNKQKINLMFKNIVKETKNINRSSIIKSDKKILQEYYKLLKELHNMSTRRKNKIDETLEELLEMNLFEDDETDDEADVEADDEATDAEATDDDLDLSSLEEEEEVLEVNKDTTVEELAMMAGLMEDESNEEADELSLEGLFEEDVNEDPETEEEGLSADASETYTESYKRRDRVLEIDENMLRREIGKMKAIREGEAKDMASHFGGGSIEGEAFVDGVTLNKLHEVKIKAAKVVRKNRMLSSKLTQYKKALRGMKSQLSEMNLFNAKLLYANKLMQNRDLSMKQQRHIVESLDDANTIGEAKILFESLSKSLVSKRPATRGKNLSEGALRRKSGAASAPVRSGQSKPLNESVALDRWATLAGIKK